MKRAGFTLVELLIVVIIIAIVASMAVLSMGDLGQSRRASAAAHQLAQHIAELQERAIVSNSLFGIGIKQHQYCDYHYVRTEDGANWQLDSASKPCQGLPNDVRLMLMARDNSTVPGSNNDPDFVVLPSGVLPQFVLRLQYAPQSWYQVQLNQQGEIDVVQHAA